ncbi:hypothetical protein K466DRAFT_637744 [Polyporus arcularius HHB13444]|uniref:Uncharacterized protein n=1 Tax=Polyporus arcularius HHB13444 TaxID=1314778 RepID=A0A5C3NUU5_9APHY|nr:hypothetical protein K466DRAFT_637744 [Polyporus arcularius HHB13444]
MADPLFPLTIDDTSPVVRYSPFADTFSAPSTAQGWNPFYTDSGFATVNSGAGSAIGPAIGNGTSLHLTACDGAALQIDWNAPRGTDITLFGTLVLPLDQSLDIPDATYSVILDGTATTNFIASLSKPAIVQDAATDILVSFRNLQDGQHTLQVVLHNPDDTDDVGNSTSGPMIAFDRAVVQVGAGMPNAGSSASSSSSASTPTRTASTAPVPDSAVAFRGQWDFEPTLLPGSSASFHTSTNVGDRATLQFNGSAVGLTGLTTPDSGAFNVSLDQERPVIVSARASFTSSSPTLLFFRSGLDPSVMHSIEVVNAGPAGAGDGAGSLLVLGAVNVTSMQPPGATPVGAAGSSSLPRGAVAGLAIGCTLAVAALVAAIIFCVRRRRRNSRRKRQMLVNPQINRAGRLSFLFPHKRRSEAISERDAQKALERGYETGGVLDIRNPTPEVHEKEESDDSEVEDEGEGEGEGEDGQRLSAAEKGKERALRRSNASKNSDGSYSIELPDLTIAQVPRGYLPASAVPSTPSPPRTLVPSPTSPRSPARPRGPRELPGRDSTRGILLSNMSGSGPAPAHADEEGQLTVGPAFLPEAHISPLRVEFASDVQDRPEGRGERHISTGAMSLPQSLRQALAQQAASQVPVPPSPTRSDRIYSFLDFSSTSTSLSRSQRQSSSNSTGKSRSSSTRSKRKSGSENSNSNSGQSQAVNWASLPPDRRISLGLSMTLGAGGTTSRSVPNINVTLHPVPLFQSTPALSSPDEQSPSALDTPEQEGPDQQFPYDANQLPSPTDSVPYTVSDIHFRHSTHSSIMTMPTAESRRASANIFRLSGSHRPPHPPLPSAGPSSPTRPTHQRAGGAGAGGSQAGSQSVPPFIVQRILGRTPGTASAPGTPFQSPTAPQFASMAAAAARTSNTPSPVPSQTAQASTGSAAGTAAGAGLGQTATPGSSTSVFGFQLGRHR